MEGEAGTVASGADRLRADCASCVGLCCVAPAFAASADFAVDKPAGTPCRNLLADFRCGFHGQLRERGFSGCAVFDCFGAGQHVTQVTFGGRDWRDPAVAEPMFDAFTVVRQLHELLWYLADALGRRAAAPVHGELRAALAATERLAAGSPEEIVGVDVAAHREDVGVLLGRVSELVRADSPGPRAGWRGADLVGRDLRRSDLRGANLRGAYLIGADLRGADLSLADLIGADLRAADVRGADLRDALFLTRFQLHAAVGDAATRVPAALDRPAHWAPTAGSGRSAGPSRARRSRRRA